MQLYLENYCQNGTISINTAADLCRNLILLELTFKKKLTNILLLHQQCCLSTAYTGHTCRTPQVLLYDVRTHRPLYINVKKARSYSFNLTIATRIPFSCCKKGKAHLIKYPSYKYRFHSMGLLLSLPALQFISKAGVMSSYMNRYRSSLQILLPQMF